MPATVINGIFSGVSMKWYTPAANNTASTGVCLVPNTTNGTVTYNSAALSGAGSAHYTIIGAQFPVTVNPGQTALIQVSDDGTGLGGNVTLTVTTSNVAFSPTVALTEAFTGTGVPPGQTFPSSVIFPPTKVALTTNFTQERIVSSFTGTVRVTGIAMQTGTDFFITGAPVLPFTIPTGNQSALFTLQFTPTVVGSRNDNLQITTVDDANPGAGSVIINVPVNGLGTTLQSAFNLTGGVQGTLFAFSGLGVPLVLVADPTNLNTEEPGQFVKLHDFLIPNQEKQLMRIRGHYEDLGAATVTFKVRARRLGQADETGSVNVSIGTVTADSWIREFISEPIEVTGELIEITVSRAAARGPVSILDYMPEFEPKGPVIGGTGNA